MNSEATSSEARKYHVAGLPGDGVGPEVYASACRVLTVLEELFDLDIELEEQLIGGAAVDATGDPLPPETIEACERSDAILLGAVGGPQWDDRPADQRPERGLLRLRSQFGLFCNLRPIVTHPALHQFSPLKPSRLAHVDLMIVRELTGGIYFGHKERDADKAMDVSTYTREEIERVTRKACRLARQRSGLVTLVDKSNVLETSRLWREVVTRLVKEEFPGVRLETVLVDSMAMHLLTKPDRFDVVLTENLFGDVLSDEASMLCGSMGLLPSAALREDKFGLYEPVHGSAPSIAGKDLANPYAMLLSVAMMLRHSLDQSEAARTLERCINRCWEEGVLTRDLAHNGFTTTQVTDMVCERLTSADLFQRTAACYE
jgi:3-isopropylmalate dehydrogenase